MHNGVSELWLGSPDAHDPGSSTHPAVDRQPDILLLRAQPVIDRNRNKAQCSLVKSFAKFKEKVMFMGLTFYSFLKKFCLFCCSSDFMVFSLIFSVVARWPVVKMNNWCEDVPTDPCLHLHHIYHHLHLHHNCSEDVPLTLKWFLFLQEDKGEECFQELTDGCRVLCVYLFSQCFFNVRCADCPSSTCRLLLTWSLVRRTFVQMSLVTDHPAGRISCGCSAHHALLGLTTMHTL